MKKNTIEIYNKYGIPENLQMHMLRVAACCKLITDNWEGNKLKVDSLFKVLLFHDMGNIVKISKDEFSDNIFQENRKKYFELYGNDDHKVSQAIAVELGFTDYELYLMNEKVFVNNENILKGEDYQVKIGAYCDQRVAPDNIMLLLERLMEAKLRYKDKPGSSMNNPKTDLLIDCAVKIEKQIMEFCSINPEDINDDSILNNLDYFKRYTI